MHEFTEFELCKSRMEKSKCLVRSLLAVLGITIGLTGIGQISGVLPSADAASRENVPLSKLEQYIATSARISKAPNLGDTIPALQFDVSDGLTLHMKHDCYSDSNPDLAAKPASQCTWGDKSATKSIFLFGDSQAASWLPAFNQIGIEDGYEIYFLADASCPPWEPAGVGDFTLASGIKLDKCDAFVSKEIDFAISIHPTIVVLAGDTNEIGNNNWDTTASDYDHEMAITVARLRPSRSQVILMSEVPQYNVTSTNTMTPTTCLTVHGGNVLPCLLSPESVTTTQLSQSLVQSSATLHVSLINVLPLFCTSKLCPLTVRTPNGDYLTHFDQYHMSRFYSVLISTALGQLLRASMKT